MTAASNTVFYCRYLSVSSRISDQFTGLAKPGFLPHSGEVVFSNSGEWVALANVYDADGSTMWKK